MSYSTEVDDLLAGQLERFVTLRPHQLAGQVGNLPFWLAEVQHALGVLDGYSARFGRLAAAQQRYVVANRVTVPDRHTDAPATPPLPYQVSASELDRSRRGLCRALRRLLARCVEERLLTDAESRRAAGDAGIDPDASA